MPKINVYVPDDLGDGLKAADLPVSAICQRALEQALRRITAIRQATVDHVDDASFAARLPNFTDRARTVLRLGIDRGRAAGTPVGTGDLLAGLIAEGAGLGLAVLDAMEIIPEQILRDLERSAATEPASAVATSGGEVSTSGGEVTTGGGPVDAGERHLSSAASNALESAMSESIGLGHHYVGTEHVLLGLIAETDGQAGQVLRARGVDLRTARRAVSAALAGLSQRSRAQRAQPPASDLSSMVAAAVRREVQPLVVRIERLERSDGTSQAAGRT